MQPLSFRVGPTDRKCDCAWGGGVAPGVGGLTHGPVSPSAATRNSLRSLGRRRLMRTAMSPATKNTLVAIIALMLRQVRCQAYEHECVGHRAVLRGLMR